MNKHRVQSFVYSLYWLTTLHYVHSTRMVTSTAQGRKKVKQLTWKHTSLHSRHLCDLSKPERRRQKHYFCFLPNT